METSRKTTVTAKTQTFRPEKSRRHELRTPGLLAKWPLIGLLLIVVGMGVFGVLAMNLQPQSPMLQTDTQMVNDLHNMALQTTPFILNVMIFGYYFGQWGIVVIAVLLLLYLLYKRFWTEFAMVFIGLGGEAPLWLILSNHFNRPRPAFATSVWRQMTAPSFPSGHTFATVLCFGLLAYWIVPMLTSGFWKAVVIVAALLITFYVGFSRVFVGDHYPSDILAGVAIGIAWGGLAYTLVEFISQRMGTRKARQRQAYADYS